MPTYVILSESPESLPSCLIEETTFQDPKYQEILIDTPHIHLRFEAKCWCEAQQVYREASDTGNYDMYFCKEDKDNDWEVCPHFDEMLIRTSNEPVG